MSEFKTTMMESHSLAQGREKASRNLSDLRDDLWFGFKYGSGAGLGFFRLVPA